MMLTTCQMSCPPTMGKQVQGFIHMSSHQGCALATCCAACSKFKGQGHKQAEASPDALGGNGGALFCPQAGS